MLYGHVPPLIAKHSTQAVEREYTLHKAKHLRDSETTVRALLEAIPDAIFQLDRSGVFLDFIPAKGFETLMPPEEFLRKNIDEVLPPELAKLTWHHLKNTLESNQGQTYEYSLQMPGGLKYFEARTAKTDTDTVLAIIRDVTRRVETQKSNEETLMMLDMRNAQLRIAAEVSKTCSSILDPDLLVQQAVNLIQSGFDLYYVGLFQVDAVGQTANLVAGSGEEGQNMLAEGYHLRLDAPSMVSWCIRNGQARIAQQADLDNVRYPNPHLPDTRSELALPLISRGNVIGALTVQHRQEGAFSEEDISSLQTMTDQLATAIENARLYSALQSELAVSEGLVKELENKNAELERFTYTVSHDLKSPLITIRGFLGYLEKDALEGNIDRLRGDVQRIAGAAEKMQILLDELLELSRIGRLVNQPEKIPFETIAQEAVSLVEGRLSAGNIKVEIGSNLPTVFGDRARLVEVVQNLVDNAAKFMGNQANPKIEIGAHQDGERVVIFVRDNGIGIESKYQEIIFGLFDKLNTSAEGTGVGLALVKRIIEVHNGKVWVESAPGKGSTFYFTLVYEPDVEAKP